MSWKNIISITDFSRKDIDAFIRVASDTKKNPGKYSEHLQGKDMALLFFEPSTRTYTSFRNAMTRLGGSISMEFRNPAGTSVEKQESMESTFAMAREYGTDILAIRHPRDGAAKYAADVTDIPVINGGDGHNEHPTQNLMDLFTVHERFGRLDNLTFLYFNDLKYGRATRAILPLSKYKGNRFIFISHPLVGLPEGFKRLLDRSGCEWEEHSEQAQFPGLLGRADVAYGSRTQEERFPKTPEGREQLKKVRGSIVLTPEALQKAKPKQGLIILHPLPMDKNYPCIAPEVAGTGHGHWNSQAGNGIPARQAMLLLMLEKGESSLEAGLPGGR